MTNFAGNVNIRQKVHLDLDNAVALARFAATAFDVETESTLAVSSDFCLIRLRKKVANVIKYAGICRRIAARRAPDRTLVDADYFFKIFGPDELLESAGLFRAVVKLCCQCFL